MNRIMLLLCLLALGPAGNWVLAADDPMAPEPKPDEAQAEAPGRWVVEIGKGKRGGYSTREDFQALLREAGYDDLDSSSGGTMWTPGTSSSGPRIDVDNSALHLGLGYRISHPFLARFFVSMGDFATGSARMYDSDTEFEEKINFTSDLLNLGLMAQVEPTPALRLGAGLVYQRLALTLHGDTNGTDTQADQSASALGLAYEFMVTLPARTPVGFFLGYQGLKGGELEIGPFLNMPKGEVSVSHSMWVFGLGVRPR